MSKRMIWTMLLFLGVFTTVTWGATLYVPGDYPTIQDAINAAADGDTIIVGPGTYLENLDFLGKSLVLKSEKGPAYTSIDGQYLASVIMIDGTLTSPVNMIEGFRIIHGIGTTFNNHTNGYGGGIFAVYSEVIISNCEFEENSATWAGGAVSCHYGSWVTIEDCLATRNKSESDAPGFFLDIITDGEIKNNTIAYNTSSQSSGTWHYGGGIHCSNCSPFIVNNVIAYNTAGYGGGIAGTDVDTAPVIMNNTIFGNTASASGNGVYCRSDSDATITNTIVWGNGAPADPQISGVNSPVTYSCVEGGFTGTGNIDLDPLFADPMSDDFHLTWGSPCRNAGDDTAPGVPGEDFERDPRPSDYDPVVALDMGADEFHLHLYHLYDVVASGIIALKAVGLPGANPVTLGISTGFQDPPQTTPFGDLYLQLPATKLSLGYQISSTGISTVYVWLPSSLLPGQAFYAQALIGDRLTNLEVLVVR